MQDQILKIEQVSHKYNNTWAVQDINLEIDSTGIFGLLGSNGAGKSTTMNIMCGVLNQTQGNVFIAGIDIRKSPEEAKKNIGFLPQQAPLYMDFTVDEYLEYCAFLRQVSKTRLKGALDYAKERCGISNFGKRLIRNLSGGYRQRVGIAQAIIHSPKLVVLDEPTNGLDPNQIAEVRTLIRDIATERAVIFSSHILSEVEVLCDQITMIANGKIVFADSITAFNNYIKPHSMLLSLENPPLLEEFLKIPGITGAEAVTDRRVRLFFNEDASITGKIITLSVQQGWELREITLDKSSVDETFAQLSGHSKRN